MFFPKAVTLPRPENCLPYYLTIAERSYRWSHVFSKGNKAVGRLNVVVPLVRVFEELSLVKSPFWSRDKVNRGIHFFHEQDFRSSWRSRFYPHQRLYSASLRYLPNLKRESDFHLYVVLTIIHVPWTHYKFLWRGTGTYFPCNVYN